MSRPSACPDVTRYEGLASGNLLDDEKEALLTHLEGCDVCAHKLAALPDLDALVRLARPAVPPDEASAGTVAGLVERLSRLRPGPTPAADEPTVPPPTVVRAGGRDMPHATQLPADTGARELYDFLAPPQAPDELGRLGPYRVLEVLGKGGMGVVFRALDPQLARPVALKAMLPALAASDSARQRFLHEARAAAAIKHDHIVTIYQVGEDRGIPYLAMELLEGEPLDVRLQRQGRLPPAEVLHIGREIALGLAAAHRRELIHRDIKPANVWLEEKDEGGRMKDESKTDKRSSSSFILHPSSFPRVKILDFGLARAIREQGQLTQQGAIVGTPAYMAPEQAQGKRTDGRGDLFSLGCVLYRMATGTPPFSGTDMISTLMAVATEEPRPLEQLAPGLPPALSALILRLLAKDPAGRPPSAQAVADELERIAQEPTAARPAGRTKGHRGIAVAAGVLLLGLIAWWAAEVLLRVKTPGGVPVVEAYRPCATAGPTARFACRVPFPERSEWRVEGGELVQQSPDRDVRIVFGDPNWVDYDFAVETRWDAGLEPAAVYFLYENDLEFYAHALAGRGNTCELIDSVEKGAGIRPAPASRQHSLRQRNWHHTEVRLRGARGECLLDGQKVFDFKADRHPRGQVGLRTWNSQCRFRNIVVKDPQGAVLLAGLPDLPAVPPPAPTGPDVRRAWMNRCGEWHIDGAELAQTTQVSDCRLVFGDPAWKDYTFTCEVKRVRGVRDVGLLYHVTAAGSSQFNLGAYNNTTHLAGAATVGAWREMARGAGKLDKARWYKVSVRLRGPHCQCFLDDQTVFEFDDPLSGQGAVGLFTHESAFRFRNCRVIAPSGQVLFEGLPDPPARAGQWPPAAGPAAAEEVHCLTGHGAPVTAVLFSRDGRQVLSASDGGTGHSVDDALAYYFCSPASTVRVWDAQTGGQLACSPVVEPVWQNRGIIALALAPQGPHFLSVNVLDSFHKGKKVQAWAVAGDRLEPQAHGLALETPGPFDAAFRADGRTAFAVGATGRLWEWDLEKRALVRELPGAVRDVTAVAIAPHGRLALLARRNAPFAEIDLGTGKEAGNWRGAAGVLLSLAFSADGRRILSGGEDGTVHLWDVENRRRLRLVARHPRPVRAVAISPDGRRALFGGDEQTVRLWDLEASKELACLTGHTGGIRAVAFSPDGRRAASASGDYTVRLWRLPEPGPGK
jgi:serine/threonine protein kinase/WD40 repeat protein